MLKKISAALIAASIFAAPAMAATVIKTERAPATKSVTVVKKTIKPSVANAKAQAIVVKKHRHHRFHRHHVNKHMSGVTTKTVIVKKHVSAAAPAKTVIVKKKG